MNRGALTLAISSALIAVPAVSQAANESPYLEPDGSWITLSGTATSVTGSTFELDYGSGMVTVDMDDWDWYDETPETIAGSKVTVYGEVDDDTFEKTKIEANSVYVEDLGTYFYASAADEETPQDFDLAPTAPVEVGDMALTGTVTSVNGREFTLDTGVQETTVDTSFMSYNPMDDEGLHKIEKGDVVTVSGEVEDDTFETRELIAESVVTLDDESDA